MEIDYTIQFNEIIDKLSDLSSEVSNSNTVMDSVYGQLVANMEVMNMELMYLKYIFIVILFFCIWREVKDFG